MSEFHLCLDLGFLVGRTKAKLQMTLVMRNECVKIVCSIQRLILALLCTKKITRKQWVIQPENSIADFFLNFSLFQFVVNSCVIYFDFRFSFTFPILIFLAGFRQIIDPDSPK